MEAKNLLSKTLKEDPKDCEIPSHKLLVKSGLVQKFGQGVYSFLPLGSKIIRKINNIIREEMEQSGCQEVMLPIIQPKELWEKSGRWQVYGQELMRLKDRHDNDYCLSPTAEEVITTLVSREIKSYKELPLNLFQIQNKYRDERRPRFGLMRSREFLMKDGYSFDVDEASLDVTYNKMYDAYSRIFSRCGMSYRAVEADSGAIGGASSHEFMVLADSGEGEISYCLDCNYGANVEFGTFKAVNYESLDAGDLERVQTPNVKSIEDLSEFFNVSKENFLKTLVLKAVYSEREEFVMVSLRGHRELNDIKLLNFLGALEVTMAEDEEIEKLGLVNGFISPLKEVEGVRVIVDSEVESAVSLIVGGNVPDVHLRNFNLKRDLKNYDLVDVSLVMEGDKCPKCGGSLGFKRGIEVGQVFKLGNKYSKALECTFLDNNGKSQYMEMGCYGIGVSRVMAAAIEQNHDDNGIIWPMSLAPFEVVVVPVNMKDEQVVNCSKEIYEELKNLGVDVLWDNRDDRPGIKFANSELIGYPLRITVGKSYLEDGTLELFTRATKTKENFPKEEISKIVKDIVEKEKNGFLQS